MIEKLSDGVAMIVLLVITITIIEMILPQNKNKKYVLFVGSLIVFFSILSPFLTFFKKDFDFSSVAKQWQEEFQQAETSYVSEDNLESTVYTSYLENLKTNIVERLERMDYQVLEIEVHVNKETYEPEKMELKVKYKDGYVQPVVIDVFHQNKTSIYEADKEKIKQVLQASYGVEKENITIS